VQPDRARDTGRSIASAVKLGVTARGLRVTSAAIFSHRSRSDQSPVDSRLTTDR